MKKGVELALNTIIIAAICLMALVVIILVFTDWINIGAEQLNDISKCQSMNDGQGNCYVSKDDCESGSEKGCHCVYGFGGCPPDSEEEKKLCCWKR